MMPREKTGHFRCVNCGVWQEKENVFERDWDHRKIQVPLCPSCNYSMDKEKFQYVNDFIKLNDPMVKEIWL